MEWLDYEVALCLKLFSHSHSSQKVALQNYFVKLYVEVGGSFFK